MKLQYDETLSNVAAFNFNLRRCTGGNDRLLYIWSANSTHPILRYSGHSAAVKAIAWSPHQRGLLASGGGAADRCIRFWNTTTTTNTAVSCMDTGSQVCNLVWSKNVNELVSTHGRGLSGLHSSTSPLILSRF